MLNKMKTNTTQKVTIPIATHAYVRGRLSKSAAYVQPIANFDSRGLAISDLVTEV